MAVDHVVAGLKSRAKMISTTEEISQASLSRIAHVQRGLLPKPRSPFSLLHHD